MEGIAGVQARIQDIISRFETPRPKSLEPATTGTFASVLAQAQSPGATTASGSIPASDGTLNPAGVDPVQWAKDYLTALGMPVTESNVRAITAWEQAEGTKAAFNPLATTQSGFAGETQFNSVGVKNFATYEDGIAANVKVINNGLYPNILAALRQGTDAMAVAQAIEDSPWGTGGGVIRVLNSRS